MWNSPFPLLRNGKKPNFCRYLCSFEFCTEDMHRLDKLVCNKIVSVSRKFVVVSSQGKKSRGKTVSNLRVHQNTAYIDRKEITHIKFSAMGFNTKCLSRPLRISLINSHEMTMWNAAGSYYFSSCDGGHLFYSLCFKI